MKYKKFLLISILLIGGFLRFYQIDSIPPGLYQDEVSIGNNAYAILTTGKDEFGKSFPLVFKSFGDYKMPLYIYGTAASIAIFGKNELAVRFLSAFSGTVTIFILYMLVQQLVNINKEKLSIIYRKYLPLLSAFLLAIFPWHIQFSRAGFETNVGLCLFLIGVLLTIYYVNKKDIKILNIAFFFFLLAFYTYHVYRVVIPLTLFILTCTFFYQHPKQRLQIFLLAIVSFFIALPMVFISLTGEGQTRFAQASAFSDLSTKGGLETIFMYPMIYIKNYLSYFYFFLFLTGTISHRKH
jgi:4-amino-4-deoxy-L-arabinose transferase-like glycosyltransferase